MDFKAYITEYNLSSQEIENIQNGGTLPLKTPYAIRELQTEARFASISDCIITLTYSEVVCRDGNGNIISSSGDLDTRCVGMSFTNEYTMTFIHPLCLWGGGGSSNNSGDNGSNNGGNHADGGINSGGGGANGSNTNPDEENDPDDPTDMTPIGTIPILTIPIDHVQQLNEITNRPEVKAKIISLLAGVTTLNYEQGTEFFFEDDPNEPLFAEDLTPTYSGIQFGEVYPNSFIRLHAHHDELDPVFSAEDIQGMAHFFKERKQQNPVDANNITFLLASNLGVFALRVTDPAKASQFANANFISEAFKKKLIEKYLDDVRDKAYEVCNCLLPSDTYEQLLSDFLIDFLANNNTGLTLFSATLDSNGNYVWSIHSKYN